MAQADEFSYRLGKTAFMSSGKYLLLNKELINKNAALKTGNLDSLMQEGAYAQYKEAQGAIPEGQYDARSLIPFIYTLYNGVEQMIMGYYYAGFPEDRLTFVPSFENLLGKFNEFDLAKDAAVSAFVQKYTTDDALPELIGNLLKASGFGVNKLITTRRALENNSLFKVLDEYQPLFVSPEQGRAFFEEVLADAEAMLVKLNLIIGDIDDEGVAGNYVHSLQVG